MSTLYVLVGVAGSGKTTWVGHQRWDWDKTTIISTDQLVERYAISQGKTYTDVFSEYMPTAVKLMTEQVTAAFEKNNVVVWDQTSTTVASRIRKLVMAPLHYKKIAVVFPTPPEARHKMMLYRPGKIIPNHVVESMIVNFERPSLDEGFDEIIDVYIPGMKE
jgi:predicted kinase